VLKSGKILSGQIVKNLKNCYIQCKAINFGSSNKVL